MKTKLAKILRRWANKLSPDYTRPLFPNPFINSSTREVKLFQGMYGLSPSTVREMKRDPEFAAAIEMDTRKELLDTLALKMYQAGAITFQTEDGNDYYAPKRIIATCHAVINPNTDQEPCQ